MKLLKKLLICLLLFLVSLPDSSAAERTADSFAVCVRDHFVPKALQPTSWGLTDIPCSGNSPWYGVVCDVDTVRSISFANGSATLADFVVAEAVCVPPGAAVVQIKGFSSVRLSDVSLGNATLEITVDIGGDVELSNVAVFNLTVIGCRTSRIHSVHILGRFSLLCDEVAVHGIYCPVNYVGDVSVTIRSLSGLANITNIELPVTIGSATVRIEVNDTRVLDSSYDVGFPPVEVRTIDCGIWTSSNSVIQTIIEIVLLSASGDVFVDGVHTDAPLRSGATSIVIRGNKTVRVSHVVLVGDSQITFFADLKATQSVALENVFINGWFGTTVTVRTAADNVAIWDVTAGSNYGLHITWLAVGNYTTVTRVNLDALGSDQNWLLAATRSIALRSFRMLPRHDGATVITFVGAEDGAALSDYAGVERDAVTFVVDVHSSFRATRVFAPTMGFRFGESVTIKSIADAECPGTLTVEDTLSALCFSNDQRCSYGDNGIETAVVLFVNSSARTLNLRNWRRSLTAIDVYAALPLLLIELCTMNSVYFAYDTLTAPTMAAAAADAPLVIRYSERLQSVSIDCSTNVGGAVYAVHTPFLESIAVVGTTLDALSICDAANLKTLVVNPRNLRLITVIGSDRSCQNAAALSKTNQLWAAGVPALASMAFDDGISPCGASASSVTFISVNASSLSFLTTLELIVSVERVLLANLTALVTIRARNITANVVQGDGSACFAADAVGTVLLGKEQQEALSVTPTYLRIACGVPSLSLVTIGYSRQLHSLALASIPVLSMLTLSSCSFALQRVVLLALTQLTTVSLTGANLTELLATSSSMCGISHEQVLVGRYGGLIGGSPLLRSLALNDGGTVRLLLIDRLPGLAILSLNNISIVSIGVATLPLLRALPAQMCGGRGSFAQLLVAFGYVLPAGTSVVAVGRVNITQLFLARNRLRRLVLATIGAVTLYQHRMDDVSIIQDVVDLPSLAVLDASNNANLQQFFAESAQLQQVELSSTGITFLAASGWRIPSASLLQGSADGAGDRPSFVQSPSTLNLYQNIRRDDLGQLAGGAVMSSCPALVHLVSVVALRIVTLAHLPHLRSVNLLSAENASFVDLPALHDIRVNCRFQTIVVRNADFRNSQCTEVKSPTLCITDGGTVPCTPKFSECSWLHNTSESFSTCSNRCNSDVTPDMCRSEAACLDEDCCCLRWWDSELNALASLLTRKSRSFTSTVYAPIATDKLGLTTTQSPSVLLSTTNSASQSRSNSVTASGTITHARNVFVVANNSSSSSAPAKLRRRKGSTSMSVAPRTFDSTKVADTIRTIAQYALEAAALLGRLSMLAFLVPRLGLITSCPAKPFDDGEIGAYGRLLGAYSSKLHASSRSALAACLLIVALNVLQWVVSRALRAARWGTAPFEYFTLRALTILTLRYAQSILANAVVSMTLPSMDDKAVGLAAIGAVTAAALCGVYCATRGFPSVLQERQYWHPNAFVVRWVVGCESAHTYEPIDYERRSILQRHYRSLALYEHYRRPVCWFFVAELFMVYVAGVASGLNARLCRLSSWCVITGQGVYAVALLTVRPFRGRHHAVLLTLISWVLLLLYVSRLLMGRNEIIQAGAYCAFLVATVINSAVELWKQFASSAALQDRCSISTNAMIDQLWDGSEITTVASSSISTEESSEKPSALLSFASSKIVDHQAHSPSFCCGKKEDILSLQNGH